MLYPALPPACLPAGLPWSSTSTDPKNSKWYDLIDLVNSYALLFLAVLLRWLVRAVQRNVCLYSGPSRLHPPKVIFIDHFAFIYFLIAHWLTSDILFGTDDSFTSLHFHSCSNNERLVLHLRRRLQIRDAIRGMRLPCGASGCDHDFIDDVKKVLNFLSPLMTGCHRTVWNNACRIPVIPRIVPLLETAYPPRWISSSK